MDGREEHTRDRSEQMMPMLVWMGERTPGGFFIYRADETQELVYVNRAALNVFGCDTLEQFKRLTGYTFRGMVHPDDLPAVQDSIERQIADESNENLDYVEYRVIRRDGEVRWVDDYGHFAQIPGVGRVYYVFIWDVTARRQAQEERFRMEVSLERERQNSRMRSEFLFRISHDLRTPMNAIVGFSDLARRSAGDPERMLDCVEKVSASAGQMMELLDDLLEMNRLEKGEAALKLERADLAELLETVLDLFRVPAREKEIDLTGRIELADTRVLLDHSRFSRIMTNLIDNAVKFTPAGGSVTVTARQQERSHSGYCRYVFTVEDTGVGMSEEFIGRMFRTFEREGTSTQTGKTGTGLGLSIVKALLDLMGGSVHAQSARGKGTVLTVELPLKLADANQKPESAPAVPVDAETRGEHRILVVEDVELNRLLTESVLEEAGFLVESVCDGCDAVEAVRNHPPGYYDLILMDIQMPVMNGHEAARAIRALGREDTARIPILALSANAREEDRIMSLNSGMDQHIAKPFAAPELIAAIHASLAKAERGDARP